MSFDPSLTSGERERLVADVGTGPLEAIGLRSYRLPVEPGSATTAVASLGRLAPSLTVEVDHLVSTSAAPNDYYYNDQWAMANDGGYVDGAFGTPFADIDAESAWAKTTGSDQVVVGVIDTGIDVDHPDLAPNLWRNPGIGGCPVGSHGYDTVKHDCDPEDQESHGTHVAGIIGARGGNGIGVTGVAQKVQLMGLRALWFGNPTVSQIVEAIHWAVEAKRAGVNLRILNASFGSEAFSQILYDEIAWAGANDILFVTAAGNGGADGIGDDVDLAPAYPCAFAIETIVCVANSTSSDELAESSNFGRRNVDLAAPGTGILSTKPLRFNPGYGYSSGTSMAAPLVSGAAALALAQGPLSALALKARLLDAVDPVPAMSGLVAAAGRLNLCKVLSGCVPIQAGYDDFSSAREFHGAGGFGATTRGAGREPGEPTHAVDGQAGGSSVWTSVWASEGTLSLRAYGHFDIILAVYTGSTLDDLTRVAATTAPSGHRLLLDIRVPKYERYWIALSGRNGGYGPYGLAVDTSSHLTQPVPPAAITALVAAAGPGSVSVNWTAPADGGSPITGYTVRLYQDGRMTTDAGVAPGSRHHIFANLATGATYTARVWATNASGVGLKSVPSNPVVVPATVSPSDRPTSPVPSTGAPPPPSQARSGYWMVGSEGTVDAFGDAQHFGNASVDSAKAVDLEPTPTGDGYWVIDDQGHVFAFGDAQGKGNVERSRLSVGETVTSLSSTPSGQGYWVFTTKGRALTFGDAQHLGDMSDKALNGPVLDSIAMPSGQGYYMVASDGGIFAFGDAAFAGSMGGRPLNAPVQSLVPDGDGTGYWLVASDGGVFAFDAGFRGSMGGKPLNKPVTGMVPFGNGYLMVGEDGGIFNYSDRPFLGSLGSKPPTHPVVSVAVLDQAQRS